jgi:hypothetical protein
VSLEERIFRARRAACIDVLMTRGLSPDMAERWCEAWEQEAAFRGQPRSGEFWQDGRLWIDGQIAARRSPGAVLVRR